MASINIVLGALGFWLLASVAWRVLYNLWLHPLARYPGPPLAALSRLLFLYHFVVGDAVTWADECHRKYGDIVRIEPGRLSYTMPEAWKEIYGHATANHKANSKENKNSKQLFSNGSCSISSAHGPEHSRLRKIFSNAFSDRALRQQEPMLLQYANQMVDLVNREIAGPRGEKASVILNAVSLLNFATFDIMADLAFGESLGSLEKGGNPWVEAVMVNFKIMIINSALGRHPWLSFIWQRFQKQQDKQAAALHVRSSHDRVTRRLEKGPDARDDIWGLVLRANGPNALTRTEMNNNANNFMIAGTETTATALSALTYLLLKHPDKLERLVKEIRSVKDACELTGDVVRQMTYFNACLEEALRMHPPVPAGGLRVIGPGGNNILGHELPEDTRMSIANWTIYRHPRYWKDGDSFVPERWIPNEIGYEEHHKYDRRDALQPFGIGPRACIGKNLAYQEMRLLYTNLLYHFDIELCSDSEDWMSRQKCWTLWFKDELNVRFSRRT